MEPVARTVLSDDDRPQGMEPGSFEQLGNTDRPVGMESTAPPVGEGQPFVPVALNITDWAQWISRGPEEFVVSLATRAAAGDGECQGTLDYFQCYSTEEVIEFLRSQREVVDDAYLIAAIDQIIENVDWLQSVVEYVKAQPVEDEDK